MFISKSVPQPFSIRTPIGGRMIARMILQMSEQVKAIFAWFILKPTFLENYKIKTKTMIN